MKRNYLMIVLSLLLVQTGYAQDKLSDLFADLEEIKNVTQVTITKSMLGMIPNIDSSVSMDIGIDVQNIVPKLDQIDIFTSEDPDMKKLISSEAVDIFDGNKAYEVLMKIKTNKEITVFYGKKDGNLFTSLVMFVNGEKNCTLIRLLGKFSSQDIQDITKGIEK
jgi:hypothetical protein